jgi:AraC-like DNA-binding protein
MRQEIKIISVLFIILIINCISCNKFNPDFIDQIEQNNSKSIVLSDLEVYDDIGFYMPDPESSRWKPVKIPFIHKMKPADFFINFNSVWLRGKFKLSGNEWNPASACYGIRLGPVSAANVVYMNGMTVGSLSTREFNKWLWPGSYVFPSYIKLKETNEVYLHFITRNKYITLMSDIFIQGENSFSLSEKWNNFFYSQLPMGLCILLIGAVIVLLYNYYTQRNKRYLIYSLFFINTIIILVLIYFPSNSMYIGLTAKVISSLLPFNILFTIIIFQSFYGIYLWKHNLTAGVILLSLSFFIITRSHNPFTTDVFLRPFVYAGIAALLYLIFLVHLLNSLKQDMYKYHFSIVLFLFIVISEVVQSLGIIFNIWYQYLCIFYSIPLFAIIIIIFEIRESKQRRTELNKLYEKFRKNGNNTSITDLAEKKIEKVIQFLNENYTSDISREGLAGAVEMNPNYLCTVFHKRTGKKIHDYINELRIADAAQQLTGPDSEKKVIDIALGVGFDSLTTFNRLFKYNYKRTPTEYKKKNNSLK